jgi:AcrR family transcriptional regulator
VSLTAIADPTPALAQALAGTPLVKTTATPAAAFARAQEVFEAGERLDMGKLAQDIGVSRATLYRWAGDRDQLLADVLWAEAKSALLLLGERVSGRRAGRFNLIASGFVELLAGSPALRAFLRHEQAQGLWLITAPNGPFRPRLVQAVIELLEEEVNNGYKPPETLELLADSMVSLVERFLHNGGDPDANPSPDTAKRAIALLLRQ